MFHVPKNCSNRTLFSQSGVQQNTRATEPCIHFAFWVARQESSRWDYSCLLSCILSLTKTNNEDELDSYPTLGHHTCLGCGGQQPRRRQLSSGVMHLVYTSAHPDIVRSFFSKWIATNARERRTIDQRKCGIDSPSGAEHIPHRKCLRH